MSRRKGRILAFHALYSFDLVKTPLNELLTLNWAGEGRESPEEEKELPEIIDLKNMISDLNHIDINKLNEIISVIRRSNMTKRVSKNLQYFAENVVASRKALREISRKCTPLIIERVEGLPYISHINDIKDLIPK